jgi:hypothetical protein
VDLSQVFHARPVSPKEDRLPEPEFLRLREALEQAGYQLQYDEHTVKKLKDLRLLYEPYLEALSQFLFVVVPPWILAKEIADNWKTTAWGRISGLASKQVDVGLDDHAD